MKTAIRANGDIHQEGFAWQGGALPVGAAIERLHDCTHAADGDHGVPAPCGRLEQVGALSRLG